MSGIVLEQLSGVPLARSRIRLDRVDTTGRVQSSSVIAGRSGQFTFTNVPAGLYVLNAMREGYAAIAFGQRRPQGTAPPFQVDRDTNLFAELRLRRLGVLTGRVLDENRVGIRRVSVHAYSANPPFRSVGHGETDDRGVFRIFGLVDGKYRVRSEPFRHDDGLMVLATYAPETVSLREGAVYPTRLDTETTDIDISPLPGVLISIGGLVSCAPLTNMSGPVNITVSFDSGRREARVPCGGSYRFDNLPPGNFELFGADPEIKVATFQERNIQQTTFNAHLDLRPTPVPELYLRDEAARSTVRTRVTLTLRRVDLAGVAESRTVTMDEQARVPMAPGWWEVSGTMPAPYYLSGASPTYRQMEPRPSAHPDWFEFLLTDRSSSVGLRIANQSGNLAGKVMENQKPVAGIPVFLLPVTAETRRRAGGQRTIAATSDGEFRFEGLPPGDYRVLASFDYDDVDDEVMFAANALAIKVEAGATARTDLAPYLAP